MTTVIMLIVLIAISMFALQIEEWDKVYRDSEEEK